MKATVLILGAIAGHNFHPVKGRQRWRDIRFGLMLTVLALGSQVVRIWAEMP